MIELVRGSRLVWEGTWYVIVGMCEMRSFLFLWPISSNIIPVNSGLIIEANLQTSATSTDIRIGPVSVASLNVTQYKHHVINNTWKFPGNHITANANAGGP